MDFFSVLTLFGGLAMFLYGMEIMGSGLKKLAGGKLESVLAKLTSNRFKGFILGLGVTSVIQSSSAVMVMLVGFVNSGIMQLPQTTSILMGANIGTTVTAWILSTSGISGAGFIMKMLKPSSFTPVLALIGIFMVMFVNNDKKKDIGSILLGFAILMFGMEAMSGATAGLKDSESFKNMLVMFANPFMGILVGTIFTAIIQSSSATVGILQALSLTTFIPMSTALPIILGMNIGAAVPPILSSISGNAQAKRVAASCVYIKIIGVVVFSIIFYLLNSFMNFGFMSENANVYTIAIVHTTFNVISTVILMPFCKLIEKLSEITFKANDNEESKLNVALDERFISMPTFAVEKSREAVCEMAKLAREGVLDSLKLMDNYNAEVVKSVIEKEDIVDKYEDKISTYLVHLATRNLLNKDSKEVTELLHIVGDVERISDHSVNIKRVFNEMDEKGISFSKEANDDITTISSAIKEILTLTIESFIDNDLEKAKKVEPLEQVIDRLKKKIKANHIERLKEGGCTVEMGFILSDLLTNFERISDHCSNIAVCLLEIENGSFDTHEYLSNVKDGGENDFNERYKEFKEKYRLPMEKRS